MCIHHSLSQQPPNTADAGDLTQEHRHSDHGRHVQLIYQVSLLTTLECSECILEMQEAVRAG